MEKIRTYNRHFFSFLKESASPFHAVAEMAATLENKGFQQLRENKSWNVQAGSSYYVIRDGAALIAFTLGSKERLEDGFRIVGAHTDSPCLKIKPLAEITKGKGDLIRLGVEVYGGALLSTWFDRDLTIAGRVFLQNETLHSPSHSLLINFSRPLLTIPSLAIHLNRSANTEVEINKQNHLPPLFMQGDGNDFYTLLKTQLTHQHPSFLEKKVTILGFDLVCNECNLPSLTGAHEEFISAGRLDNLLSCYASLQAISENGTEQNALFLCSSDEENGSLSAAGANGNFLQSIFERLLPEPEARYKALAQSFFISMDNAHASHPNYPTKMDSVHDIYLNRGPVIKFNANQRYATSGASAAIFHLICHDAGLTPQKFVMRSDMACGSTIGPMTAAKLGIRAVDIGAASLAMHSIRELTGYLDPWFCYQVARQFYGGEYHL